MIPVASPFDPVPGPKFVRDIIVNEIVAIASNVKYFAVIREASALGRLSPMRNLVLSRPLRIVQTGGLEVVVSRACR